MVKNFREELDIALLADVLHSKHCTKPHFEHIVLNNGAICNHHHHNAMVASSKLIGEAQKTSLYYKKAKEVYELCEGMNTNNIIKLIKTIMD